MWGISYWALPLLSASVWLAMLLAMLITWIQDGSPHYSSMADAQTIAYISDIGAQSLKPLFISMSAVTVVTFDLAFLAEIWLRRSGRLAANTSRGQKTLSALASIAAVAGAAGLILLSVFDTLRHENMHNGFLVLFIGGYIVSAIFVCAEYQRLGIYYREYRILRASFWIKLFFILTEVALAIAFGVCQRVDKYNEAAILEWVIALIFAFYVASFFLDFIPAVRTKNGQSEETTLDVAMAEAQSGHRAKKQGGRYYSGFTTRNSSNRQETNDPTRNGREGWI